MKINSALPFMGKLRYRLMFTLSVFLLVVVGGCVLLYVFFATDYYIYEKSNVLESASRYIDTLDLADISDSQSAELESYESRYTIRILIADKEFNLVYASGNFSENSITQNVDRWIAQRADSYQEGAQAVHMTELFSEGDSYLCLSGLVSQGSGNYYVCLYENIQSVAGIISYFNRFMVVLLVLTLLAGACYVAMISRQLLTPIERIDQVAGKIADGDLSVRVRGEVSQDELGDLTRKINQMADTIQSNLNRLENYNAALQRQNETMGSFEQLQKQFVSQVTHELKTPLAIISTQAEMLEWSSDEEQRRYYCESIMEEVGKMSRMISDVLTMSFDEHRLNHMIMERIDLAECCRSQIKKYDDWMAQRQIRLSSVIDEQCMALFSRQQFEQILNNFVMNACQHTPENGSIVITLRDMQSDFFLSVYNSGDPIDEADRDKIWTGYYHLKSLNRGHDNGPESVGLGLFIVRDIVKTCAGECDFTNLEDGVVFWVKIPKKLVSIPAQQ